MTIMSQCKYKLQEPNGFQTNQTRHTDWKVSSQTECILFFRRTALWPSVDEKHSEGRCQKVWGRTAAKLSEMFKIQIESSESVTAKKMPVCHSESWSVKCICTFHYCQHNSNPPSASGSIKKCMFALIIHLRRCTSSRSTKTTSDFHTNESASGQRSAIFKQRWTSNQSQREKLFKIHSILW